MANVKNGNRQLNVFLNRYSDLMAVILICLSLLGAYILVIRPRFNSTIQTITQNMEEQEMIFKQQSQKLQQLKANLAMYQKMDKTQVERLARVLPNRYVEERLFGELEEMVAKSGYTVSSIDITKPGEDPVEGVATAAPVGEGTGLEEEAVVLNQEAAIASPLAPENLKTVEVSLSIGSIDYAGLKNLLPVFENSIRLIDIIEVNFSPADKKADLVFQTYYYQSDLE